MSLSRNPDPVAEDNPQILLFHNNNLTQFDRNMLGASSSCGAPHDLFFINTTASDMRKKGIFM